MNESSLQAGASVTDITPPLEVGLLTSSVNGTYAPFESVRLPLKARVLVLRFADESAGDCVAGFIGFERYICRWMGKL